MPAGAITLKNFVGKDRYLRFDLNAFADMERETGKGISSILKEESIGLDSLRLLFWAGTKWSDKRMDIETAGNVIEQFIAENGKIEDLANYIQQAIEQSGLIENLTNDEDEPEEDEGPNAETPEVVEPSGDGEKNQGKKSRKRSQGGSDK